MVTNPHPGAWSAVSASALGSSHRLKNAPNQDAVATFEIDDGLCLAVADGHGGSRYVRSADGSRIAVEIAKRLGSDALRRPERLIDLVPQLPARLVSDWRAEVAAHLSAQPFDADSVQVVGADPLVAYGTTLLMVLLRGDEAVALQLGDGDVVVAWNDGTALRPVPEDGRNVAGQTTSMCLADAVESFRIASLNVDGRIPQLVLASTDGYGNSFADPRWPTRVSADLIQLHRRLGTAAIAEALPRWAAESAEVGGDDTTVAVVFRDPRRVDTDLAVAPPRRSAAAPPTMAIPTALPTVASATPPRRGRSLALPLTAAATLLVGAVAGFFVGRSGDDAEVPPTATEESADPNTTTPDSTIVDVATTSVPTVTTEVPATTGLAPPTSAEPPAATEVTPTPTASVTVLTDSQLLVAELSGLFTSGPICALKSSQKVSDAIMEKVAEQSVVSEAGVWVLENGDVTLYPWEPNGNAVVNIKQAEGARSIALIGDLLIVPWVVNPNSTPQNVEVLAYDATTGEQATTCGLSADLLTRGQQAPQTPTAPVPEETTTT